jgi:hypothetical protein
MEIKNRYFRTKLWRWYLLKEIQKENYEYNSVTAIEFDDR